MLYSSLLKERDIRVLYSALDSTTAALLMERLYYSLLY
jgi:hypothetical protein